MKPKIEDQDGYSIAHFIAYNIVLIIFALIVLLLHLFFHNWIIAIASAGILFFGVWTTIKLLT